MSVKLNKSDIDFIRECFKWSEMAYKDKAQRYLWHNGKPDLEYRKNNYEPTLKRYQEIPVKIISILKKELNNGK